MDKKFTSNRRNFLKTVGLATTGIVLTPQIDRFISLFTHAKNSSNLMAAPKLKPINQNYLEEFCISPDMGKAAFCIASIVYGFSVKFDASQQLRAIGLDSFTADPTYEFIKKEKHIAVYLFVPGAKGVISVEAVPKTDKDISALYNSDIVALYAGRGAPPAQQTTSSVGPAQTTTVSVPTQVWGVNGTPGYGTKYVSKTSSAGGGGIPVYTHELNYLLPDGSKAYLGVTDYDVSASITAHRLNDSYEAKHYTFYSKRDRTSLNDILVRNSLPALTEDEIVKAETLATGCTLELAKTNGQSYKIRPNGPFGLRIMYSNSPSLRLPDGGLAKMFSRSLVILEAENKIKQVDLNLSEVLLSSDKFGTDYQFNLNFQSGKAQKTTYDISAGSPGLLSQNDKIRVDVIKNNSIIATRHVDLQLGILII